MKAIQADVGKDPAKAGIRAGMPVEEWPAVCKRFNDDVERVCDADGVEGYTALYRCCDEDNTVVYYLVNEDKKLFRLKRKHFFNNIGYGTD